MNLHYVVTTNPQPVDVSSDLRPSSATAPAVSIARGLCGHLAKKQLEGTVAGSRTINAPLLLRHPAQAAYRSWAQQETYQKPA
ncbi:hypothetical protein LSAT2_014259 [Lamellibrachia satsuma]|nr:hypothetical protein LSAT2_014259 [Lamellibrachia satsuma]